MREHFEDKVPLVIKLPEPKDRFAAVVIEADLYMSFWYAELYVVIEGWQELGLSDPTIDELLKSPNVGLLKRYRHGVFHFQPNYFDNRFLDFMGSAHNPVAWVRALNLAFGAFFLSRRKPEDNAPPGG